MFSIFLNNCWFLRKRIAAKVGILWGKTIQKWFSESRTFIKICFLLKKSSSIQNLMRCKTFFRNPTRSKISIQNLWGCEKTALSLTHLKFLIQNMTCGTTNDSKTDYFQKFWSQKSCLKEKKTTFSGTIFPRMHKKSQFWRFLV